MFGMPGQHKNFGMGVILDMKNNTHGSIQTAIKDFEKLHGVASDLDKKMLIARANWNRGMDMMASATRNFVKAGVIAGGTAWIASLGKDTEQANADLKSLGVGVADLAKIKNEMYQILSIDRMPIPKKEAMDALKDLKSAEVATQDLSSAFKAVGTTSIAAMGTVKQATDAYTTSYLHYFKSMGGSIEEKNRRFADTFVSSVNVYKTWLPELSSQFVDVAAKANMMGMKFEEIIPAMGTLLHGGLGQEAGTSLNRALENILNAEKVLGIKLTNSRGKMLPLLQVIDRIKKSVGSNLQDLRVQNKLTEAFDMYGSKSIRTLLALRNSYAEGIKAANNYGIAQRSASDRTDTLIYDYIRLKNSVSELGDAFSENSGIRDTVKSLTDLITASSEFIKQNPMVAKSFFKIAEALIAIYGAKAVASGVGGLWKTGAAVVGGIATIIGKVTTGTYNPLKWFPRAAGTASEATATAGKSIVSPAVEVTEKVAVKSTESVAKAVPEVADEFGHIPSMLRPGGQVAETASFGARFMGKAAPFLRVFGLANSYFELANHAYQGTKTMIRLNRDWRSLGGIHSEDWRTADQYMALGIDREILSRKDIGQGAESIGPRNGHLFERFMDWSYIGNQITDLLDYATGYQDNRTIEIIIQGYDKDKLDLANEVKEKIERERDVAYMRRGASSRFNVNYAR